jgi:exopolysaccharide biosynthesis polyprenyl glycosylphosphotransferase
MSSRGWFGPVAPGAVAPGGQEARRWVGRLLPVAWGASLMAVDVLLTVCAFLLAHWVRFIVPDMEALALGLEHYLGMGLAVSLITVALLAMNGLYDGDRSHPWPARLHLIVSAVSTALVLAVAVSFLLGDQRFSRLWFAAGWGFAVVGLVLWRTVAPALQLATRTAAGTTSRVLIVGANPLGQELAREVAATRRVVGYVDNGSDLDGRDGRDDLPLLGSIAQLEQLVQAHGVDEIVVALPAGRREQVGALVARGFHRPVTVKLVPDLPGWSGLLPQRFEVRHVGAHPCIGFAPVAKVSWLKRATDLILATLGVLVAAPALAAIALAIKLDSPGPVFYRQQRIGKDGRPFWILKFRSMRPDAERLQAALRSQNQATGPLFKMKDDPRVTRVGRLLRRSSLDELPQLFNVLRGEMSLVGPRPPVPAEVAQYEDWQHGRLRAMPGITGLWQVNGRSEVPFHDMVRLDLHYIRNWSLGLDLEILLRTIPVVLTSRGAY